MSFLISYFWNDINVEQDQLTFICRVLQLGIDLVTNRLSNKVGMQ